MREQREQRHSTSIDQFDRKCRPSLTAFRPRAGGIRLVAWAAAVLGLAGLNFVGVVQPVFAHVDEASTAAAWSMWQFTPDIVIATMLITLVYIAGRAKRRGTATLPQVLRHTAFFTGMAVVFLALQPPIDSSSEPLFAMPHVQHLLLRMA